MGDWVVSRRARVRGYALRHAYRGLSLMLGIMLIGLLVAPGTAVFRVGAQDESAGGVPMFRGNPARTGELPGPGPNPDEPIVEHWSFDTEAFIASSPVVADGVAYIANRDGDLSAIDATTGSRIWTFDLGYSDSTPAVVDGVVYAGSSDNDFYAIDAKSGQQVWLAELGGDIDDAIVSSPVVVDGVVYVGSTDGSLYALDAASGRQIWTAGLGPIPSSPAVVDGIVYVTQKSLELYALDAATGQELWMFEAGNLIFGSRTSPAVADGTVFAFSNFDGELHAVDIESGQQRWAFDIPIAYSEFNSLNASPAVANGTVYLSGSDALYAIDAATGQERWNVPLDWMLESSPVVVDGIVYAGSQNGFYGIDAESGEVAWSFPSDVEIFATPAIADGVIYLAFGSRLVAFGNPTADMRTATAEAEATSTAQAYLDETATAIAGTTATAQAYLDATATSVAGATATVEMEAMATEEAVRVSWQDYFWTDITGALSEHVAELPGVSVGDFSTLNSGSGWYVPEGYSRASIYPIVIAGGSAAASVTLAIFPSKDDADTAMENMSGGLLRSGWESQKGTGLKHNHACLTIQHADSSQALCYMTRDDALISSYSSVGLPNPEAALLNAIDLANAMNDAYNEVERPD